MDKKELRKVLKIDKKKKRIKEIEKKMSDPDFWNDKKKSTRLSKKLAGLKDTVERFKKAEKKEEIEKLKTEALLDGKFDDKNAIITISAGTGGVDAQDWADMLLRMYLRFAKEKDWQAKVLAKKMGKEAGIKEATLYVKGNKAYGFLKTEAGVHRLVRKSPFNAQNLRQTSFALVDIIPEIEEEEIEIKESDLKVETFRSSGPGGQSVNTTDSAVRVVHKPTDISVSVQNEKSQARNKKTALKILKSKLAKEKEEKKEKKIEESKSELKTAKWGNQIRSYILDPYQLVKDHRTNKEMKDVEKVLDGKIYPLIISFLKQKK